jgi:hypothetical protein
MGNRTEEHGFHLYGSFLKLFDPGYVTAKGNDLSATIDHLCPNLKVPLLWTFSLEHSIDDCGFFSILDHSGRFN